MHAIRKWEINGGVEEHKQGMVLRETEESWVGEDQRHAMQVDDLRKLATVLLINKWQKGLSQR